jgi:asparagine synthase (glutamine-hydrolysing)
MCGIVAVVQDAWSSSSITNDDASPPFDSQEDPWFAQDSQVLEAATQLLNHRGPDGWQVHRSNVWGMGHTRLAIVDPTNHDADMPFALKLSNGSTLHWVANGEIYNHNDLYKQYGTLPRQSQSDCEAIGHVYASLLQNGNATQTPALLDGMFAFVLVEEDAQGQMVQVLAARDPVGIKPLYTARSTHGAYVFSSELKALVGHVDPATVVSIPAGHYWTPQTGLVCYYHPEWLCEVCCTYYCSVIVSTY